MAKESYELNNNANKDVVAQKPVGFGIRHVQMLMMTFAFTVMYVMRSSMGIAILAMTDKSQVNASDAEIYEWGSETSGIILSSFYLGYFVMQVPSGVLGKMYGGKIILFLALIVNGVLCLATPILAKHGSWIAVCFVRALMGLAQACLMPGAHTLLGQWAPIQERTRFSTISYAGMQIGTVLTMPLCGLLTSTRLGWRLIFYAMGGLALTTAVVWWSLTASTPAQHRLISKKEVQYIESSLESKTEGKLVIPWKKFMTSVPLVGILFAQTGWIWCNTLFLVEIPMYLKNGLDIDLTSGATLSALPFLAQWLVSTVCSLLSDHLYNRKIMSLTQVRKLFNSLGSVLGFVGTVALSFVDKSNTKTALFLLTASTGIIGANTSGFMLSPKPKTDEEALDSEMTDVTQIGESSIILSQTINVELFNHIDMSPRYGGILFALTNAIGNLIGLLGPISAGYILGDDPTDITRWRIVFCISGTILLASDVVYRCLATSERQTWDDPNYDNKKIYDKGNLKADCQEETGDNDEDDDENENTLKGNEEKHYEFKTNEHGNLKNNTDIIL